METKWYKWDEIKPAKDGEYLFLLNDNRMQEHQVTDGEVVESLFYYFEKERITHWAEKPKNPEFEERMKYFDEMRAAYNFSLDDIKDFVRYKKD